MPRNDNLKKFMPFSDKMIICEQCSHEFLFSVGEQKFFAAKGFNHPKLCVACKQTIKTTKARRLIITECALCSIQFEIPYKPDKNNDLNCLNCFEKQTPTDSVS